MSGALPIKVDHLLHPNRTGRERIEYQAGWNPESVLHTMSAFANDFNNLGGGYIVLGVEEHNGRPLLPPKGLDPDSIEGIRNSLLDLGNSAIRPLYHPIAADYEIEGRMILVLWAPGGETRPYQAKVSLGKRHPEWAYYVRKLGSTERATREVERELFSLAATVPFDDRYCQTSSLDDLSHRLVCEYLRDIGSDPSQEAHRHSIADLGQRMNIIGGLPEALSPKNVGLMFFNEQPHRIFPATQINVVWLPDGPGGDRFEEKEFRGPLSAILKGAIRHIDRNFLKQTVVKFPHKPQSERFWNFPIGAIEEAIVNAMYHRSYETHEPVEVCITHEEVLVLSYPGADRSIRMEDFRKGQVVSRRYRNRRIGEFLKELDLAKARSTGIPRIFRAMRRNGSPDPIFESDDERTWFRVRLPVHEQVGLTAYPGYPPSDRSSLKSVVGTFRFQESWNNWPSNGKRNERHGHATS